MPTNVNNTQSTQKPSIDNQHHHHVAPNNQHQVEFLLCVFLLFSLVLSTIFKNISVVKRFLVSIYIRKYSLKHNDRKELKIGGKFHKNL